MFFIGMSFTPRLRGNRPFFVLYPFLMFRSLHRPFPLNCPPQQQKTFTHKRSTFFLNYQIYFILLVFPLSISVRNPRRPFVPSILFWCVYYFPPVPFFSLFEFIPSYSSVTTSLLLIASPQPGFRIFPLFESSGILSFAVQFFPIVQALFTVPPFVSDCLVPLFFETRNRALYTSPWYVGP